MKPIAPVGRSSSTARPWATSVGGAIQFIHLLLIAFFLIMVAWSAISQVHACEMHASHGTASNRADMATPADYPVSRRDYARAR
jgi:hypothetical protein